MDVESTFEIKRISSRKKDKIINTEAQVKETNLYIRIKASFRVSGKNNTVVFMFKKKSMDGRKYAVKRVVEDDVYKIDVDLVPEAFNVLRGFVIDGVKLYARLSNRGVVDFILFVGGDEKVWLSFNNLEMDLEKSVVLNNNVVEKLEPVTMSLGKDGMIVRFVGYSRYGSTDVVRDYQVVFSGVDREMYCLLRRYIERGLMAFWFNGVNGSNRRRMMYRIEARFDDGIDFSVEGNVQAVKMFRGRYYVYLSDLFDSGLSRFIEKFNERLDFLQSIGEEGRGFVCDFMDEVTRNIVKSVFGLC